MTVCFGACIGGLLESDKLGLPPKYRDFAGMVVMACSFQGGILLWIRYFLREASLSWRDAFGLEASRQGKAVLWGMAGAIAFIPVALALQFWVGDLIELATRHPAVPQTAVQVLEKTGLPTGQRLFMGVLAVLIAPPAEEILFRGIFYPTIKQSGFPKAAWWITSLLFAGMHFNVLSFIPLMVFSFVLIALYEKTGSLWASMTAHSLFNFANFVLVMLTSGDNPVIPGK